ncbi:MAG: 1-deoxy-D-xylulose-5-phosphate reductoisomerase [Ruminococcus sp.]|nr:1-deoxy-D-xylulose-5-phosphate reductoisomerase [Ruminococcus sp.]
MKRINLLGSGGSIGMQTAEVCRLHGIGIHSAALKSNYKRLAEQAREFDIKRLCIYDEEYAKPLKDELFGSGREILTGKEGLCALAADDRADITVNSVVGMVGLEPTLAALENGMDVALANKETLAAGGDIVMRSAKENHRAVLPIDSEHSAIFQCLMCARGDVGKQLKGIILTASGGPFFGKSYGELENVTLKQALAHPNWSMGAKITIDSATFMNKGLELMEACHLFGISPDQVEIVVHRQSVVHSAVVFSDNAVVAQLGVPDMKIPIQFALTYPERVPSMSGELSLTDYGSLTFEKPDAETFICLKTAVRAAKLGGTAGSIVNGANERAAELFMNGRIGFNDIGRIVSGALESIPVTAADDIESVLKADAAARKYADGAVRSKSV